MVEATELILRAWRETEFEYRGRRFNYPRVALLPRPVQQPNPPIWVGAARTPETFEWAGRNGFDLMVLPYMFPPGVLDEKIELYREALRAAGHDPAEREILAKFHVFVADSAHDARRLAADAYDNYQRVAGARSGRQHANYWRAGSSFEQQVAENRVIAGSPDECIERIRYWRDRLGITHLAGTFHFGGLAQDVTLRSIERFAREVAPAFREQAVSATASAWAGSEPWPG
jgi:alkanesulfonate monooxygenase SsuD/methylene tetrahydromethanopterin reductase-like flavin-dependent oxidoreductase (luciferase family)